MTQGEEQTGLLGIQYSLVLLVSLSEGYSQARCLCVLIFK